MTSELRVRLKSLSFASLLSRCDGAKASLSYVLFSIAARGGSWHWQRGRRYRRQAPCHPAPRLQRRSDVRERSSEAAAAASDSAGQARCEPPAWRNCRACKCHFRPVAKAAVLAKSRPGPPARARHLGKADAAAAPGRARRPGQLTGRLCGPARRSLAARRPRATREPPDGPGKRTLAGYAPSRMAECRS